MEKTLPLHYINTFYAAAEHLSFQKASEYLFVTPSAISHKIRKLEKILGYKLFERLDKHVILTSHGEVLFNDIQAPIIQLQKASRKARKRLEKHSLTISVAPIFATGWLLSRLNNFKINHPEINIKIISTSDLVDFNSNPFDAAIRMGKGNWKELTVHSLFNCEIVAVCHPTLLDSKEDLLSPHEILNYPLINNTMLSRSWNEWFQSAEVELLTPIDYSLEVQSSAQVIEVLQSGDSIGFVDRNFIEGDLKSGRLTLACNHRLHSEFGYFLVFPKAVEPLPSIHVFKNWIDEKVNKSEHLNV